MKNFTIALALLMTIGSQVVAEQLTFKCTEQTPNGPQPAFLDVILEVNTSDKSIKVNPQSWTETSTIIDWGDRFLTWVQHSDTGTSTLLAVFDRETSKLVIKGILYEFFDPEKLLVQKNPIFVPQNLHNCTKKAF